MPVVKQLTIGIVAVLICICVAHRDEASAQHGRRALKVADLAIVLTTVVDVERELILFDHTIVIDAGRLVYVGPTKENHWRARQTVDGSSLIALPGFVNTHTHLWQHAARSVQPSGQLQDWARQIYAIAPHAKSNEVLQITRAAAGQALLNGITTVADFASINYADGHLEATLKALQEVHIGGALVFWRPIAFLPPALLDLHIRQLKSLAGEGHKIVMGFGPLSFFPLPAVYDGILAAHRNGLTMSEHSMENLQEARDFRDRLKRYLTSVAQNGWKLDPDDQAILADISSQPELSKVDLLESMSRLATEMLENPLWASDLTPAEKQSLGALPARPLPSPIKLLDHLGALKDFLAIHSVWPDSGDLALLRSNNVSISHNPESNMYLASGVSPLRIYKAAGIRVTLGTDGAASNDRINMFDAMRTAALLQKVSALNTTATAGLSSWFLLKAATIEGAKALGVSDRTGSLTVGKEADVVLLDAQRLSLSPLIRGINDIAMLVHAAEARDIAYVIADGKVVVNKGRLTVFDEPTLAMRLSHIANALAERTKSGAGWQEHIALAAGITRRPWWRYWSIRKGDLLDITVLNKWNQSITVGVAFSGTTFGGTAAQFFDPKTVQRFPSEKVAAFWARSIALKPGHALRIERKPNATAYTILHEGKEILRNGREAEQILLFVGSDINLE